MASILSWIFRNKAGDVVFRYEGPITDMPIEAWINCRAFWAKKHYAGKQPCVLYEGELHYGEPEIIWQQGEDAPCTTNCKNAKGVYCQCSCKGKNHGINRRDEANSINPDDIIYIGD